MAGLARYVSLVFTYSQALFYGFLVSISLAVRALKYGKKLFAQNTNREEPRCLNDRTLGEHKFVHIHREADAGKGIKIHYVMNGDIGKPLMLLIHGFPELWYSWRNQLKEFSKDYCVVAIDQRGYGRSDKPDGVENYSLDKLTEDVRAIIKALGRQSVTLVGHDWGGVVSWATAMKYPELVERLIILNCPHPAAFRKLLSSSLKQIRNSWYMSFFQLPYLPELSIKARDFGMLSRSLQLTNKERFTKDDLEAVKYNMQGPNGVTAPLNYYRAMVRHPAALPKRKLGMPVLIIWGTADLALCTELAAMSCAYCENVTLKTLQGISHWVQQDDPDNVNKHMWQFLRQGSA